LPLTRALTRLAEWWAIAGAVIRQRVDGAASAGIMDRSERSMLMADIKIRPELGGGTSVYVWAILVVLLLIGAWVALV
jgi:hypothetical protein